jgi:hypothetical protein
MQGEPGMTPRGTLRDVRAAARLHHGVKLLPAAGEDLTLVKQMPVAAASRRIRGSIVTL